MPHLPPLLADRPCPVCGARAAECLHVHRLAQVEGAGVHTGYRVACCGVCGAVYADGIPGQDAFDALYAERSQWDHAPSGGAASPADQRRFTAIAAELAARLPGRDLPLLEIGCSTGGLLAALRAKGFTRLTGRDPSPACAEAVARLHGLPAETGTLFSPITQGAHACIVAVGVMEHVVDLDRAFANLRDALLEGGLLVLEVPDAASFLDSEEAPFQELSLEHVTFFTAGSLARLASRFGFRLREAWQPSRVYGEASRTTSAVLLLERSDAEQPPAMRDETGRAGMLGYLARERTRATRERQALAPLLEGVAPYAVWGAGTLTCRLAAEGCFDAHPPVCFVDRNPHLQGRTLLGRPILPPEGLAGIEGPVLLATYGFREGMLRQARAMGLRQCYGMEGPLGEA